MDETKEKIRAFLSRFFQTGSLGDDDDIFAQGFVNSLFAMQLVLWVEKEFGIQVGDEDLEISNFNCISAIAALVAQKRDIATECEAIHDGTPAPTTVA